LTTRKLKKNKNLPRAELRGTHQHVATCYSWLQEAVIGCDWSILLSTKRLQKENRRIIADSAFFQSSFWLKPLSGRNHGLISHLPLNGR
jgi:hypothetical protein